MLDRYSHVPPEIAEGAIQAVNVLNFEAHRGGVLAIQGYHATEAELDVAFDTGVGLVLSQGHTENGIDYSLDPLQPDGAWILMSGSGQPDGPASFRVETRPRRVGDGPRELTIVDMSRSMGVDGVARMDPRSLTINQVPARPIVRKSVIQLVNFTKSAFTPRV